VVINLWEETVWAGFSETRLENRFNIFIAGVLTAVPSAGVHMPLLLIGDHTSALSILKGIGLKGIALKGIAGLVLGLVVRLMIGVVMRADRQRACCQNSAFGLQRQ
jgi:uncharacterized protein